MKNLLSSVTLATFVLAATPALAQWQPKPTNQIVDIANDGTANFLSYVVGTLYKKNNKVSVWIVHSKVEGIEVKPSTIAFENVDCSSGIGTIKTVSGTDNDGRLFTQSPNLVMNVNKQPLYWQQAFEVLCRI